MKSTHGVRCLATVLVLLDFVGRFESFELKSYYAADFTVLVPHMIAPGLSEPIQHVAAVPLFQ